MNKVFVVTYSNNSDTTVLGVSLFFSAAEEFVHTYTADYEIKHPQNEWIQHDDFLWEEIERWSYGHETVGWVKIEEFELIEGK